jgi:zinc/manganese transport system substrate-binding protein
VSPGIVRVFFLAVMAVFVGAARAAPLKVATLSTVLTEFVSEVGGSDVTLLPLLPAGMDPHTFEPSPRELASLQSADLILTAGLELEPGLLKAISNSATHGACVNLSPAADPHWWNSVTAAAAIVRRVAEELKRARPSAGRRIDDRAAGTLSALAALDRQLRQALETVPPARRILVTSHDAFAWFARDYGFRVFSLTGINAAAEPNARDLARIVDIIRGSGVKTIFLESAANARLIRALAEETGARVGGTLYADGLSPDGDAATYAGMMRHNVSTLVDGLK